MAKREKSVYLRLFSLSLCVDGGEDLLRRQTEGTSIDYKSLSFYCLTLSPGKVMTRVFLVRRK